MPTSNHQITRRLILSIISGIQAKGASATKTKILKFLYLADVAYYRATGSQLTDFEWTFFHYGPWTSEYDRVLAALEDAESVIHERIPFADGSADVYETRERLDIQDLIPSLEAFHEFSLAFDAFADRPLPDLLNYVYFETEPLKNAERYQLLDFGTIDRSRRVRVYRASSSGSSTNRIRAVRSRFQELRRQGQVRLSSPAPNPRYDEGYWELIDQLSNDTEE